MTDNATTFTSLESQTFLEKNKIKHITKPPFHSGANGAGENAIKTIKNALKKVQVVDINSVFNNFIFDYCNIKFCSNNRFPAELMFNRKLRIRIEF